MNEKNVCTYSAKLWGIKINNDSQIILVYSGDSLYAFSAFQIEYRQFGILVCLTVIGRYNFFSEVHNMFRVICFDTRTCSN